MELQSVGHDGQDTVTGSRTSTVNLGHRLDHDEHALAMPPNDTVVENGMHTWAWRELISAGGDRVCAGKVILVKCGETIKKIGIDASSEAIKEAIRSSFGLRTNRAFWLEDCDGVIRSLDREMPAGAYDLHLDEGVTVKICVQEEDNGDLLKTTEEKTFYTEEGFREYLRRRKCSGLRDVHNFRDVDTFEELQHMGIYQRV